MSTKMSSKSTASSASEFKLKREISLASAIAIIGGSLIGSGIFMTPGGILSNVNSVGASLTIWVVSGIFSMGCALCYLEWGLLLKESGGEYTALRRAYGDWFGFLSAWSGILISKPGSMLLITYTFSEYLIALVYPQPCVPSDSLKKLVTAGSIILVMFINIISIKLSNFCSQAFWYAKLAALAIVIGSGMYQLGIGNTQNFIDPFKGSETNILVYGSAFYGALWGYDGWNQLSYVTEEIKDPARNFPIALAVAIPLVTVIYLLTNIAYLTLLTPVEIVSSSAVAVTYAYRALGSFAWIVPIGVVCSTFGTANISMMTAGRIANVAARRSHIPRVLSYIDCVRFTPSLAIMLNAVIACVYLIPDASNFSTILDLFQFTTWIFYGTASFAVVVLRYREPFKSMHRPFKVWIWVPCVVFLFSLYLIVSPVINNPDLGYVFVLLLLLSGLVFYIPIHVWNVTYFDKPMDRMTLFLQKILQLAPSQVKLD